MGHSRCFFYFFNFRTYIGILSRISLKKNWSLELSQKASELNFYLVYLDSSNYNYWVLFHFTEVYVLPP